MLTESQKLAIRTESFVEDLNGQEAQLDYAISLFVIAGEILNCVKRKIFYGAKGEYDPARLDELFSQLGDVKVPTVDEFTEMSPGQSVFSVNTRIAHAIIGKMTESSELGEVLKAYVETGKVDSVNLVEEVADDSFYSYILQDEVGISTEGINDFLVAKLSARYGDKFDDVKAILRDLGSEREVMQRILDSAPQKSSTY